MSGKSGEVVLTGTCYSSIVQVGVSFKLASSYVEVGVSFKLASSYVEGSAASNAWINLAWEGSRRYLILSTSRAVLTLRLQSDY